MTREEIDILWHKAMRLSIEDGTMYTRYRFAELVIEECAKFLEETATVARAKDPEGFVWRAVKESATAIRARGETK